jgi:hypothetical protein
MLSDPEPVGGISMHWLPPLRGAWGSVCTPEQRVKRKDHIVLADVERCGNQHARNDDAPGFAFDRRYTGAEEKGTTENAERDPTAHRYALPATDFATDARFSSHGVLLRYTAGPATFPTRVSSGFFARFSWLRISLLRARKTGSEECLGQYPILLQGARVRLKFVGISEARRFRTLNRLTGASRLADWKKV